MPYYHVIAKTVDEDKYQCLFADLSMRQLKKQFVRPYGKDASFFSGNDLFSPSKLRSILIVRTDLPDEVVRNEMYRAGQRQEDDWNRNSESCFYLGLGRGNDPEDIVEGGEDVTRSLLKGPPGFRTNRFARPIRFLLAVLAIIGTIIAGVIVAGITTRLGWR